MRAAPAIAAVAALAVVAGCSGGSTAGTAQPAPPPPAESPSQPSIARPLDPSRFLSDPCTLVSPQALSELGFTEPGKPKTEGSASVLGGPGCEWLIGREGIGLSVAVQTPNRDRGTGGLAGVRAALERGQLRFSEPGPDIDGYPSVYAGLVDGRDSGRCTLWVGIADDLTFTATSVNRNRQQSCDAAGKLAAAVVGTLKQS
ncbi:DUF3558 domain-containing protein [Amycolatopsis suaedae]|uniref:DUF3558 domain-containing protein n=1 Tax=Amycolatopsis suaedae TaxID=2510978 RepID=UPI001F100782|nr:DUF3558 domain-containing protein [Amycolatopsis suaedae]